MQGLRRFCGVGQEFVDLHEDSMLLQSEGRNEFTSSFNERTGARTQKFAIVWMTWAGMNPWPREKSFATQVNLSQQQVAV